MNQDRFWLKIDKISDKDNCWLWTGALNNKGYGVTTQNKKSWKAHRFAYLLSGKVIPDDKPVLRHSGICKRNCCNPDHLTPGTTLENNQDMIRDNKTTRGTKSFTSKLTEEQVKEIRTINNLSYSNISRKYKVSPATIRDIILNKTWTWLK